MADAASLLKIARDFVSNPNSLKDFPKVEINVQVACAIADAFESAKHSPDDEVTRICYLAFVTETRRQCINLVERGEIEVIPWLDAGQPYPNSSAMRKDVIQKNRLFILLTKRPRRNKR
jgi:hypothetical protein